MELHPILEENIVPNHNLWYVVSAFGDRPSLRVGHTCTSKSGADEITEQVFVIGGANPSETFSDIHTLDTKTLSWNMGTPSGFTSRYEHITFAPLSHPDKLYVLAGADQDNNICDPYVQCYSLTTEKWSTVKTSGTAPSPRTHHTTAVIGDVVYIFSGGKTGADPVQDRQVYSFNASTNTWQSLSITGDSPTPRAGHTFTVILNKIYCFGGMAGTKLYNDIHILDIEKGAWIAPKVKKRNLPEPRAAHAAVSLGTDLYVFGGLDKEGMALQDLWKFDTTTMLWSQCPNEGPPPASRLDMASCVISWNRQTDTVEKLTDSLDRTNLSTSDGASEGAECSYSDECKLLLIHGGMDTQGEIFDDCLVYRLS